MSRTTTAQPGEKLFPSSADWKNELFKSCDPVSDGIIASLYRLRLFISIIIGFIYCFCGSCCAGRLHERTGEHYFTCCVPGATQGLRTKIRMAYGIQGSLVYDWLALCCGPCALLQMKKELDLQGVVDPFAK